MPLTDIAVRNLKPSAKSSKFSTSEGSTWRFLLPAENGGA
jgi:hypothetical protein